LWFGIVFVTIIGVSGAWIARAHPGIDPPQQSASIVKPPLVAGNESRTTFEATGYIVARRQATVSAKTTGRVMEMLIEEGQRVNKNQVIARLDDSNTRAALAESSAQVEQSEANVRAARSALNDAFPIFQRTEQQHSAGLISAQSFDSARANYNSAKVALEVAERAEAVSRAALAIARQNQDDTVIRAPFTGILTVKAAQAGDMVSPVSAGGGFTRTGIGTVVDMDSLELDVDVDESFIARVRIGQPAKVTLNAYPERGIPAQVIAVIPAVDRAKGTVKVRIGFAVKDPRILPDMAARVSLLSDTSVSDGGDSNNDSKGAPAVQPKRSVRDYPHDRRSHLRPT
jgi:RND family efflux transporter MFP subunit